MCGQEQGQRPNEKKKFPVLPTSIHPSMRYGRSCFFTLGLAMAEECAHYSAWLFVLHTSRKQRCFFFFFLLDLLLVFVSVRDLFLLLWFCTIFEEKGGHGLWEILGEFSSQNCFCNLNERRVFGKQEKMARWDSDDDFSPRGPTFCEILLAIILPPIGVFLKYGCAVSLPSFCFPLIFFVCSSLPSFLPLL